MHRGIDVSSNNGTLDLDAIKASGIEFAIIRIGYGSDEANQDDTQAIRNMQECERVGLPYGAYLYSYALNDKDAVSEASHMLRMVQGHNPQLGLWFDMEDADGYKERHGINVYESRQLLTDFCKSFCDIIKATGYKTGIYANKNYFNSVLLMDQLDSYDKWLAIWGPETVPEGDWILWQYTSDGVVQGSSTRTDMNYYYGELPKVEEVSPPQEQSTPQEPQQSYAPGETVTVLKAEQYNGQPFTTYYDTYQIIECKGDRAVIGVDGQVTAAINITNIVRADGSQSAAEQPQQSFTVGASVRVLNAEQYSGGSFTVYYDAYTLMELSGDRAVIGVNGQVTAAINICNIELA